MRLLFIISLFSSLACAAQQKPAHANDVLNQATETARAENKNVLVVFTASWCGWCHRMKKSLEEPDYRSVFNKYYVIRYLVADESESKKDLENPGAGDLKEQYNGKGQGLPYWLVLDKQGQLIADSRATNPDTGKPENTGCPATEREVNYFVDVLKKTSAISNEEAETIRKRFRENEK